MQVDAVRTAKFRAAHIARLASLALAFTASDLSAKTPGATYCFGGWCHRVSTLDEMSFTVGRRGFLKASYYDHCSRDRFNPCGLTSSGEVFRPEAADNAASPIFPDGTVVLAYNPNTRQAAVLRINSTGPYRGDRTLDVSRATAEKLGFLERGIAELDVSVLTAPDHSEARYSKLRIYPKVAGHIGEFSTFESAERAALGSLRLISQSVAPERSPKAVDAWLPPGLAEDLREIPAAHAIADNAGIIRSSVVDVERDIGVTDAVAAQTLNELPADPTAWMAHLPNFAAGLTALEETVKLPDLVPPGSKDASFLASLSARAVLVFSGEINRGTHFNLLSTLRLPRD